MIKKLINSNIKLFIITIILIIFSLPIIINSTPNNKNINELHSYVTKISYYNNSLCNSLNLDSNKTKDYDTLLTNSINKFKKLSKSLKLVSVTKNNEEIRLEIQKIISNNISLYETSLYLISNPNSTDCSTKLIEYEKITSSIKTSYKALNSLGLKCSYPNSINTIVKNTSTYVNKRIYSALNKDIKTAQLLDFYRSMTNCLDLLTDISEDLKPALDKIKEDNRSLDVLLLDIKSKKTALSSLKTTSTLLSVPEEGKEVYTELKLVLDNYELYISSLQYALEVEQTSPNSTTINSNYDNSFTKYKKYINSFKELKTNLDNFYKKSI